MIEIPFKRVVWNEHEAALLVDTFEKVRKGIVSRDKAIVELSKRLRNRMILDGIAINEKYRNVSGMDLQLLSLERSVDNNGDLIEDNHLSQTFRSIYQLSKNKRETYDTILSEAILLYPDVCDEEIKSSNITNTSNSYEKYESDPISTSVSEAMDVKYIAMSSFCWNKYEATLLIDGYYLSEKRILVHDDIVSMVFKRFNNCLSDVNRCALPSIKDVNEAYRDIELLAKSKRQVISNELQDAFDMYHNDEAGFKRILHEAKLLYPLEKSDQPSILGKLPGPATTARKIVGKNVDEKILTILAQNFSKGYRLNSPIARKRFAMLYTKQYGKDVEMTNELIDIKISETGIVHNGMVYVPSSMINENTKQSLFDYIENQFANGIVCIYYNVLFEHFSQYFLGQTMVDGEMLHSYLEYNNVENTYHFYEQYFSKEVETNIDINKEVINYVKEQGGCVTEEEITEAFIQYPKEKVIEAFSNNYKTLVLSGMKTRFHIDNFQLEDADRIAIVNFLLKEIASMQYVTFAELFDKMKEITPRIIDNNIQFTKTGIRTALSSLLSNKFHFIGGIISDHDNPINVQNAFIDIGRGRESFNMSEVDDIATNVFKAPINFEALAKNNVRVSEDIFVNKKCIAFNVDMVDKAISLFCKDEFVSITEVNTFSAFPECGYRWTPFLLESYLYSYSKMFTLRHKAFNKTSVTGAIVRMSSQLTDYLDIMATALAHAGITLDKQSSLDFLAQNGYIERRRLDTIDDVIRRAVILINN